MANSNKEFMEEIRSQYEKVNDTLDKIENKISTPSLAGQVKAGLDSVSKRNDNTKNIINAFTTISKNDIAMSKFKDSYKSSL